MEPRPEETGGDREVGFCKPPVQHQFKAGNPGRPKGARSKLGEDFLKALQKDFEEHGVKAIADVRESKPDQYLKVIASILPKEIDIGENTMSALKQSRDAATEAFFRAMAEEAMH